MDRAPARVATDDDEEGIEAQARSSKGDDSGKATGKTRDSELRPGRCRFPGGSAIGGGIPSEFIRVSDFLDRKSVV